MLHKLLLSPATTKFRRYLNHETAVKVANALVSSRLDYCNLLLYNTKRHILADYRELKMPYVVQCTNQINLVMSQPSCTNYTGSPFIILFKYNLLTFKAIHSSQPSYLPSLIRWSDLTRGNHLSISSSKPNKRSFIVAS